MKWSGSARAWLSAAAIMVGACDAGSHTPCNTCTVPDAACSTEDASAYGWVTCGAVQIFRTCTCTGGAWNCGECPDASTEDADASD